jgi:RHS repeat-associated protein
MLSKRGHSLPVSGDPVPIQVNHYHTDHLGTPMVLTEHNGNALWVAQPDDWAAVRGERKRTEQPIRFQGQYHDEESGLFYNHHRYYDPQIGRYVTQDPKGLSGGDANVFSYVSGNPISLSDPSGLRVPNLDWTPEDIHKRNCLINQYRKSSVGAWEESRHDRNLNPADLNKRDAEHFLYAEKLTQDFGGGAFGKVMSAGGVFVHEFTKVVRLGDSIPATTSPPTQWSFKAGWDGAMGNSTNESPLTCSK